MEAKFPPKSILKKLINNQENLGLPLRQVLSINGSYP